MPARPLRFGIKMAQMGGSYAEMREAWLEADRLGFDTAWGHDHLLNQNDIALPEDEGWTVLTALLAQSQRIRGGLMVTANTFRHPSLLAKIATTVDRISNRCTSSAKSAVSVRYCSLTTVKRSSRARPATVFP